MSVMRVEHRIEKKVKGPHSPTSQLLPIMINKFCSGDGEGRKDKGGGGGKMVCDKVVCVKDGVVKVLWWKHRTSSVKIDVFSMQQVQTHSASTERGSVESLCRVQDLSGQPPALASEWKIWIHNWQYATRHSHYSLYLYIYYVYGSC